MYFIPQEACGLYNSPEKLILINKQAWAKLWLYQHIGEKSVCLDWENNGSFLVKTRLYPFHSRMFCAQYSWNGLFKSRRFTTACSKFGWNWSSGLGELLMRTSHSEKNGSHMSHRLQNLYFSYRCHYHHLCQKYRKNHQIITSRVSKSRKG